MNTTNILQYLEESAARLPEKTAIIDQSASCTYSQLLLHSQRAGSALSHIVRVGEPVAVLMEKGICALYAFFGIVYAGGHYTLFNPSLPQFRMEQVQMVLQAGYVVTDINHKGLAEALFPADRVLLIEDLIWAAPEPDRLYAVRRQAIDTDPLYINFTSGSTGQPKGVVVSHRSAIDFIETFSSLFGFGSEEVIANQAPFDFDVSVKDIYTALKLGGTLVITPMQLFSRPMELLDWLCNHQVTTMIWAVSALCLVSTFHALDYNTPLSVKNIFFSGEVMPVKHLKEWMRHLPDARYVNLYGPTEITCNCTYHVLDPSRDYSLGIPIGSSFPNEHVFLLDRNGAEITAPNQLGELCVRGSALALGYLCAPEQTRASFVQNPLNPRYPEIIYRTGDLGKYNAFGELVFCGRRDHQYKHRGHRIELQEIEGAMAAIPGVDRCICIYEEQCQKLHGFYTGTIGGRELYQALRTRLPGFMIPEALHPVSAFPLNKNGKIDRNNLLKMKEGPHD